MLFVHLQQYHCVVIVNYAQFILLKKPVSLCQSCKNTHKPTSFPAPEIVLRHIENGGVIPFGQFSGNQQHSAAVPGEADSVIFLKYSPEKNSFPTDFCITISANHKKIVEYPLTTPSCL